MKKISSMLFLAVTLSLSCYAEETQIAEPSSELTLNEPSKEETALSQLDGEIAAQATNGTSKSPCTSLPADQQSFSNQLNAQNKTMFCNTFSVAQRKAAMSMVGTGKSSKMTADQAVEKVAKDNNLNSKTPSSSKSTGGCPARQ